MTRLSIVISHHLTEIQTGLLSRLDAHNRCNFIKWVMLTNKDLNAEINPDAKWEEFTKSRFFVAE